MNHLQQYTDSRASIHATVRAFITSLWISIHTVVHYTQQSAVVCDEAVYVC